MIAVLRFVPWAFHFSELFSNNQLLVFFLGLMVWGGEGNACIFIFLILLTLATRPLSSFIARILDPWFGPLLFSLLSSSSSNFSFFYHLLWFYTFLCLLLAFLSLSSHFLTLFFLFCFLPFFFFSISLLYQLSLLFFCFFFFYEITSRLIKKINNTKLWSIWSIEFPVKFILIDPCLNRQNIFLLKFFLWEVVWILLVVNKLTCLWKDVKSLKKFVEVREKIVWNLLKKIFGIFGSCQIGRSMNFFLLLRLWWAETVS